MKGRFKPLVLAVSIAMTTQFAPAVQATGFPVVDLASIAEAVTSYTQDLRNYLEYVQQTSTQVQSLEQAINLYQQSLASYNEVLRQMETLKSRMSQRDWEGLYNQYKSVVDNYPGSPPGTGADWEAAVATQDKAYYQGNSMAQMQSQLDSVGLDAQSTSEVSTEMGRVRARADTGVQQRQDVEKIDVMTKGYTDTLKDLDTQRADLGPEDNLKTLQLMADQQHLGLQMQQQQMVQQNTQQKYSNQFDQFVFSKAQKAEEVNLKEQALRSAQTIPVNENPITNW